MFNPCDECDSLKDCAYNEQCYLEHEFDRGAPGFNHSQQEEDRLNNPQHTPKS